MKNTDSNSLDSLSSEIERLSEKFSGRNLKDLRDEMTQKCHSDYSVVIRNYPFGERVCLEKTQNSQKNYEDLQSSRTFWWHSEAGSDAVSKASKLLAEGMKEGNKLRVKELDCLSFLDVGPRSFKSVCEIGFRTPEILKHFIDAGAEIATGYDVVSYNVLLGREMGYDVHQADIGDNNSELDLSNIQLVMCYQVLEHISDPLLGVKKIFESMDSGAYFHVEIPIEPGNPRLEWGHLYGFHENDLESMCHLAGFKMLFATSKVWTDGPHIRRILCQKN